MKKILSISVFFIILLIAQSCKKDAPSTSEITSRQLSSGVWKVKSVTIDGTDRTDLFTNFTLQCTATTYTTTNGTPVWPVSGTWKFKDNTAKTIIRDDELEIAIESITETELVYSLTWAKTTYGGGRANSVSGIHKFDMIH